MNFYFKVLVLLLIPVSSKTFSQNNLDSLALKYENKAKTYNELVYCHLNKIKFLKGEDLAFKAYVLNKNTGKLSKITNNLYCRIVDENQTVIKEGLFIVNKGTSHNIFKIDSLFTNNKYYFQAYTNWQRNTQKDYTYSQEIEILDFESENQKVNKLNQKLDVQILPEGGNFISGVMNTLGVIVKNEFGLSIKPEKVSLIEDGIETKSIVVNSMGLGKFNITPLTTKNYKLKVNYRDKVQVVDFPKLKNDGTNINVSYLRDKILVSIQTKKEKLDNTLVIHNSVNSKLIKIESSDKSSIVKVISYEDLFSGVNILTLLDQNNKPISERLIFNYKNIKSSLPQFNLGKLNDSLRLTIKIPEKFKNTEISLSVLPNQTKSSNPYSNIISHFGLKHFINGTFENPNYYFTNINFKKEYELDLLCMTQGWSSYDYNNLINEKESTLYDFEKGIDLSFNVNKSTTGNFIVHQLQNTKPFFINLTQKDLDDEPSFQIKSLFPITDEVINVSEINKNGTLKKASLVVNFKPNKVPIFNNLKPYEIHKTNNNLNKVINPIFTDELVVLDEVTINAEKKVTKYDKLKKQSNGTIDVFDDVKRSANLQFSSYIASKGFLVQEQLTTGELTILNPRRTTLGGLQPPIIFLDGVLLSDFNILSNFTMDIVDYIEIDKSGTGQGIRGARGFIKIYTDPKLNYSNSNYSNFKKNIVKVPLAFKAQKKYYTPKYYNFQSNTFNHYGILKWVPNVKIDANGLSYINIPNTNTKDLYISLQGIDENGNYILFEDIVNISNN